MAGDDADRGAEFSNDVKKVPQSKSRQHAQAMRCTIRTSVSLPTFDFDGWHRTFKLYTRNFSKTGTLTKSKAQEQSTLSLVSETDAEVALIMNPPVTRPSALDVAYSPDAEVPEEQLEAEGSTTDDAETPRIYVGDVKLAGSGVYGVL